MPIQSARLIKITKGTSFCQILDRIKLTELTFSAAFSNFGPEVDVFALGVEVTAACTCESELMY
jgi:hypothetical protein